MGWIEKYAGIEKPKKKKFMSKKEYIKKYTGKVMGTSLPKSQRTKLTKKSAGEVYDLIQRESRR